MDGTWLTPPGSLDLREHEVHVWRASLDVPAPQIERFWEILGEEERERGKRFRFHHHRARFIAAHGILRTLLGRYLNTKPSAICFSYNAHGKPALDERSNPIRLRFNISHSHGLALYAVSRGRELGVDLEWMREDLASQQIAERFFSPWEVAELRKLPQHLQTRAFFACWTRKEAFIKARGQGLSLPLDRFDVSLSPGQQARLLRVAGEPDELARWSLQALSVAPGFEAALAVEGDGWQISYWQWTMREGDNV